MRPLFARLNEVLASRDVPPVFAIGKWRGRIPRSAARAFAVRGQHRLAIEVITGYFFWTPHGPQADGKKNKVAHSRLGQDIPLHSLLRLAICARQAVPPRSQR